MLSALRVENLAIVERLELSLSPGLNVLTGETGAGKSILVQALRLLLGDRATSDLVRAGAAEAVVEGLMVLSEAEADQLRSEGLPLPSNEVVVRRVLAKTGRGRVTINGQLATVAMLQSLMRNRVDLSTQHEHISLLDADRHVDLLDAFGGLAALRDNVGARHAELCELRAAIAQTRESDADRARREDYLRFQLDEIVTADPKAGELDDLEAERHRLRHAGRLVETTSHAEAVLYGEEGAVIEVLGRVQRDLEGLVSIDPRLEPLSIASAGALAEIEEIARALSRYGHAIDADPARLSEVEDRVELLKRLVRKHGASLDDVVSTRARLEAELESIEGGEARRAELEARASLASERLAAEARALSAARAKAARKMEAAIAKELASLSMSGTELEVQLRAKPEIGARGAEGVELCIAPNPGEPLRPLARVASGGELSRVLLALKVVLADKDGVGTYVFDEVDSGVGGKIADVLGQKLCAVGADRQVVCITHLPQVAAYADAHYRVAKHTLDGRTISSVERLSETEGVEELARMLGGADVTQRSLQLAREMRALARGGPRAAVRTRRPERPEPKVGVRRRRRTSTTVAAAR